MIVGQWIWIESEEYFIFDLLPNKSKPGIFWCFVCIHIQDWQCSRVESSRNSRVFTFRITTKTWEAELWTITGRFLTRLASRSSSLSLWANRSEGYKCWCTQKQEWTTPNWASWSCVFFWLSPQAEILTLRKGRPGQLRGTGSWDSSAGLLPWSSTDEFFNRRDHAPIVLDGIKVRNHINISLTQGDPNVFPNGPSILN